MIKIEYLLVLLLLYSSYEQDSSPKLNLIISKMVSTISSTSSTTPASTPFSNTTYTYNPKLFLIGFGNYDKQPTQIFFNIFLKPYDVKTIPQNITIIVDITYSTRRLRFLEEKTANCELEQNESILDYKCIVNDINSEKQVKKVSIDPNKIKADDVNINIVPTTLAKQACNNIQDQKTNDAKKDKIIFNVIDKEEESNTFKILGIAEEDIKDKTILLFTENKNITCDVKDFGDKKYELTCKPTQNFKADLNGAEGILESSEKNILLNFPEEKDGNIDFEINKIKNKKSSSSGLSSGAIVGIIIACVAVLIAVGIVFALLRKSPKPPMQEINETTGNSQQNLK